ncbi:MAG: hypothetical protein J2P17_13335 [Mycobacterium sp.]|nr:hypothetical protein [Mycobacterium sp.]
MPDPIGQRTGTSPERPVGDRVEAGQAAGTGSGNGVPPVLHFLTTVGSPVALGAAILFYFGWVRTTVQMRELGFDSSVMDLSTTDYLLKSINVLSVPFVLFLILALLLHQMHHALIVPRIRTHHNDARVLRICRLLGWSWCVWILAGVVAVAVGPPVVIGFTAPVSILLALLCALYGRALRKHVTDIDPWPQVRKALMVTLLAFVVFWTTERVARTMGEGFAADIIANPRQLAAVTIFSTKGLDIAAPGVQSTVSGVPGSLYRYRYAGLRLLQRSGDRYFLINELWNSQNGRVIVLRDNDDIRLEFSR